MKRENKKEKFKAKIQRLEHLSNVMGVNIEIALEALSKIAMAKPRDKFKFRECAQLALHRMEDIAE